MTAVLNAFARVVPPLSEQAPAVTGGEALILFFMPNGEIQYKAAPQLEMEALASSDY